MAKTRVFLLVLDGWGVAPAWGGNTIAIASTPNYDHLWQKYPRTTLYANGSYVGLPGHEMGNSEVGHLNIGSGRVIALDSTKITASIEDGSFFENPRLNEAIDHAQKRNGNLHILGLCSDGGVHSDIGHLWAILELCQKKNFNRVFVDAITDGRDSEPMSAQTFVSQIEDKFKKLGFGQISTVGGRYYYMDRDRRWERTELAYNAMVKGQGLTAPSALKAISNSYTQGKTDEFITPTVIVGNNNKPVGLVKSGDSIIFFNFRSDRARQISQTFMADEFGYFPRGDKIDHLYFIGMIPYGYEQEIALGLKSAFGTFAIKNGLSEVLSNLGLSQLHIAETEKYAHVTYFFNGGREELLPKEERILIPSSKVKTYDLKPEMSAPEITKKILTALGGKWDFIIGNFANGDMVGHTGNFKAAILAVEAVDKYLGQLSTTSLENNWVMIITADHGNIEEMIFPQTGEKATEHSKNPVPFILVGKFDKKPILRIDGVLADIAPTILDLMGIEKPKEMTGKSLIVSSPQPVNTENDWDQTS